MSARENTSKGPGRATAGGTALPQDRAARLKAALKANIGRRKEQARARAGDTDADAATEGPETGPNKD